jgi:hypothetical protein
MELCEALWGMGLDLARMTEGDALIVGAVHVQERMPHVAYGIFRRYTVHRKTANPLRMGQRPIYNTGRAKARPIHRVFERNIPKI